ncbi:MAG: glycoside hydrolase family 13 protein [Limnothrix sp.]
MPVYTPDWVKEAVFYQIFPDRFARTTQQDRLIPAMQVPLEAWDSSPTIQGYKGGDLWGVIDQLDYLQELGVTALYFNPIFQSACNHRYHTHDYYNVDPLLGGNQAFAALLKAAHDLEIKVVLDGVFNHASRGFFFFNDILENGPHSPWVDWFKIHGWPLSAYDGSLPANYEGWVDNRSLPEFNHENAQAREYIMQVAEYWIRFGIDGWRLDVPNEIEAAGFWQEFRERVKAVNPEAYIVGEIWQDARPWLDGTQFDGVMNYLFTEAAIAFAVGDEVVPEHVAIPSYRTTPALDAVEYGQRISEILELYDWDIQLTQLNLLASHDTARLFTIAGGETGKEGAIAAATDSVILSTLLLMTFPGAPCIYYGDEVGLGGAMDPDCRRTMPPESEWKNEILQEHKALIQLRRNHPALQKGDYKTTLTHDRVYGFLRQLDQPHETIMIVVNAGNEPYTGRIYLEQWGVYASVIWRYGAGSTELQQNILALTIPPRSGLVIQLVM